MAQGPSIIQYDLQEYLRTSFPFRLVYLFFLLLWLSCVRTRTGWSLHVHVDYIYSHARWELPYATQVFVVALRYVFRALINSLVCWLYTCTTRIPGKGLTHWWMDGLTDRHNCTPTHLQKSYPAEWEVNSSQVRLAVHVIHHFMLEADWGKWRWMNR